MFLIVDGHSIHKAKRVKVFVEAQAGRLKLFYLPPYCKRPAEAVFSGNGG